MARFRPYITMRETREDKKQRLSIRGQNAVNKRWSDYHASCPCPDYADPRPADMYRITVENLMTNETHVLVFHPGPRTDNYSIDVDGKPWKTCGWSGAMGRLRQSCVRLMRRDA